MLDDFQGAGLATLREISVALQRFKAAGKPVVAWGSRYDQRQYHVASAASEVLLHPMGMVLPAKATAAIATTTATRSTGWA